MYFHYGSTETEYLKKKDAKLAEVIDELGHINRTVQTDLFSSVIRQIIGQQISMKAQASIWNRMQNALGMVNEESVCNADRDDLHRLGISYRKVDYIKEFAQKVSDGSFDLKALWGMEDDEVIARLTSLRGIGIWTAQMILLFCMERPDVLSYDDLAILRGLCILYHHREISRELFEKYQRRYSPYGSVASLYLWEVAGGRFKEKKGDTMDSKNIDKVHQSFAVQAKNFEGDVHASRQAYLDHTVEIIAPSRKEGVLEVAAGTCVCGRQIAQKAAVVTCLDTTPEMLEVGKVTAKKAGLRNMVFVLGDAANLPFLNDTYDIVISRLAFHHIPELTRPFSEMVRVTKSGGRVIVIDLEAAEESLRKVQDGIETMRDPSHARTLSSQELTGLFEDNKVEIIHREKTKIEMTLNAWMELTKTPSDIQTQITQKMKNEINGGDKTGFDPYLKDGEICFRQRWQMVIGRV